MTKDLASPMEFLLKCWSYRLENRIYFIIDFIANVAKKIRTPKSRQIVSFPWIHYGYLRDSVLSQPEIYLKQIDWAFF